MACGFVSSSISQRPAIVSGLPYLAVRGQRKGQVVNPSDETRKRPGTTRFLKNWVISPLSTKPIKSPPTGTLGEYYPLRAHRSTSFKADNYIVTKPSEIYDPLADRNKRLEKVHTRHRDTYSVSWQSIAVMGSGSHHTVLELSP